MHPRSPTRDPAIAQIASRQRGLVTRQQLRGASLTAEQIKVRLARGQLHRVHLGVFTVGTPLLLPGARELAAVLACQPNAYASHRSAAHLLSLLSLPRNSTTVEVTVAGRDVRRHGIRVHRVRRLYPGECGEIDDIPCTSPARTILDLAGRLDASELEALIAEAHAQDMLAPNELITLLHHHRHRRGIAPLRALTESQHEPQRTRSKAERRLLTLLRKRGLPEPRANVRVAGHEVDLLWADHMLAVEFDSFRFHSSRHAFETDRRRDQVLAALGYTVLRVTWIQLTREPHATADRIAAALILRRAPVPAPSPHRSSRA
jgi:very-short-patch-repair endonuclease